MSKIIHFLSIPVNGAQRETSKQVKDTSSQPNLLTNKNNIETDGKFAFFIPFSSSTELKTFSDLLKMTTINSKKSINLILIILSTASRTGPYFDLAASKNVIALLGKTAYLNCRVKNLGNKTVSSHLFSQKAHICLKKDK